MADTSSAWTIGTVTGLVTAAASWIVYALTGGWRARGVVADLDKKMSDQATAIKDEMRMEHDTMQRRWGEIVNAMQHKIGEVAEESLKRDTEAAMWGRDNFVRQQEFIRTIEALSTEVRTGFRDISTKIDKLKGN